MKTTKRKNKWIIALLVVMLILFIYRLTKVPEQDEEISEQIEEIEWENIDRIEIIGKNAIYIVKEEGQYRLLLEDTAKQISNKKIIELFKTFNNFQLSDLKAVEFEEWIKQEPDTSYMLLKLYTNTEQVLDLYITPTDGQTFFRYTDGRNLYKADTFKVNQLLWLDSLMKKDN